MVITIAHRGASAIAPENTLASIHAAIALGVDYVETDVRLTQDGVPILLHDADLNRTGGMSHSLPVHQLSFKEIQKADAGTWFDQKFAGEKVPST